MEKSRKGTPNPRLKHERELRGWSQEDVAERIGAASLSVRRWEHGTSFPNPYFRQQLSSLFGKNLQELGLIPDQGEVERETALPDSLLNQRGELSTSATSSSLWTVPYRRNPFFTGRDTLLTDLRNKFTSENVTAQTRSYALCGLGGIGKTQIAVEYAYRHRRDYRTVLWVKADTRETLLSDFVSIAGRLNLPEKDAQHQHLIVAAVKRWLEETADWLLILDNVEDLLLVSEFLPSEGSSHILLTTRIQATGSIASSIPVENMTQDESTLLVLRRAKVLNPGVPIEAATAVDRAQAQGLAIEMDGLPLALDQAGAYIEETACGLSGYWELYQKRKVALLKHRSTASLEYPYTVVSTWSLSFQRIEQVNQAAAELLRLCAFLHPDAIPEAMITGGASELDPVLQSVAADPHELNRAIRELLKYSLMRRNPNAKTLSVHRLVQEVLKSEMDEAMQRRWAERVVRVVKQVFPEVTFATWSLCQQYLPHARICATLVEQWNMIFDEAAQLLNRAGIYLHTRVQYAEAEPLLKQALTIYEQTLGPEHPHVALSLSCLAALYQDQGEHRQAEPLYQRALSICEQALGPEHPDVAVNLNALALLYRQQGKYVQGESLARRALTIREQALGPEHPDVAVTLNVLALLCEHQGKYTEAELLYERALAIREQALEPEHPDVGVSLGNLALLHYFLGKYAQGEPLARRSLIISQRALGPKHPSVSADLNALAKLYRGQGKYDQAEPLYQQALAIREETLGLEHFRLAIILNNLAELSCDQGKYYEAEQFCQRALAICAKTLESEHPLVMMLLNTLAEIYRDQGKYHQGEDVARKALEIGERTLSPDLPDVAASLNILAELCCSLGKYNEAEQLCRRALAINKKSLGSEHPDVAVSLNTLASLHQKRGEYTQAEELYLQTVTIRERVLGPTHPHTAASLNNLASLYAAQGKHERAESLYQRALEINVQALGAEHPAVATVLKDYADLLREIGREQEAATLDARAEAIRAKLRQAHGKRTRGTVTARKGGKEQTE
jgi:tetratricopeptide (TPR) repeat protein/transcriptional regulator with XRE-family HTH domain